MASSLSSSLEEVAIALCDGAGSALALEVREDIIKQRYGTLLRKHVDPSRYDCSTSYLLDAMVVDFLRKLPLEIPEINRADVARSAFWQCERDCRSSNLRISRHINPATGVFTDGDLAIDEILRRARKWVSRLLGRAPSPDEVLGRHGPGATFCDRGKYTTVLDKMSSKPTITGLALSRFIPSWTDTAWARALASRDPDRFDPDVVRGNRFTTVPKDGLKDRGIAIEPSINVYYQLGVGAVLRRRLLRAGIDLNFGQERHRQLACEASRKGHLATIDLSNASDTICRDLIRFLLPEDWFSLLDSLRSPFTQIDGKWVFLEKFSSMGNGFTFELETLVFCSLIQAVSGAARIGVNSFAYGDDLIVPNDLAPDLLALLRYCGFTPNERKTFVSGRFRESCGGDFFDGRPVRAHFQKVDPSAPEEWISLSNGIRRLATQLPGFSIRGEVGDTCVAKAWMLSRKQIPSSVLQCTGPELLGDLVLHDVPHRHNLRVRDGVRYYRSYKPVQRKLLLAHWDDEYVFAGALYGIPSDGIIPRDSVAGYRIGWTPCVA